MYVDRVITLKIGDPNVCPNREGRSFSDNYVTDKEFVIQCCPNFIYQNGQCEECPPGKFGWDCLNPCIGNYYGLQCQYRCRCKGNMKCHPIYGCVCNDGFTGKNCSDVCPAGRYGLNCSEECFCPQDAQCDSVNGNCLCPAGWFGNHCTKGK
ncbi:MEGF10_11 [Mytilus edulis]|uniref:MEGF10_11 n=1 Tax=Mytilus edulis TaxID=6550 RepID=A0A8S3UGV4_MYTED|nr:MEGF10_11 [Mytilus edulis]